MSTTPQFLWWRSTPQESEPQTDESPKRLFPELQEPSDPVDARPKSSLSTQANWGSPISIADSPSPFGRPKSLLEEISEQRLDHVMDVDGEGNAGHGKEKVDDEIPKEQDHVLESEMDTPIERKGDRFEPMDVNKAPLIDSGLPPELWTIVQSSPANFTPHYFLEVSRNLLENPNLTASHLSRAELSYQSFTDASFNPAAQHPHELASIIKHLKADHQPLLVPGGVRGYTLEWTVVRNLIPRNPKLDDTLLQTCHLFTSTGTVDVYDEKAPGRTIQAERYLIVYLPHATDPEKIPFYHPKIRGLAILYTYQPSPPHGAPHGTLSLYYDLFPERLLDNRMTRTALKMLEIIHKHSRGRMAGYQKRVHHDVVIAQKPFQDTYAYLKGKYCKDLIDKWVEQTPAEKHVFEDLGIAAFLIELWTDMYGGKARVGGGDLANDFDGEAEQKEKERERLRHAKAKANFPGFVDIGCGNGILIWILNQEGWNGWGFDARRRKTWATFDSSYDDKLKEMLLVPEVLMTTTDMDVSATSEVEEPATHNGIFPTGTFIVANHADELTIWTPCLAFLSESPFIAIPCCSHNFGGTRFRAPSRLSKATTPIDHSSLLTPAPSSSPSPGKSKPPTQSAYASFSAYTTHIAAAMNYRPESEYLRIPSTRNFAIIGREKERKGDLMGNLDDKMQFVRDVVEKEMGMSIEDMRRAWVERGSGLLKPGKGGGH